MKCPQYARKHVSFTRASSPSFHLPDQHTRAIDAGMTSASQIPVQEHTDLAVRVPVELRREAMRVASEQDRSLASFVRATLRRAVKEHDREQDE